MSDQRKIAANLERWRRAVATHDVENPTHTSWGIGLSQFDLDRLGFTEGEVLWEGITVEVDGKTTGNFRVLCDGDHDECDLRIKEAREAPPVDAAARERELVPS
jgi:hypothetical protein